MDRAIVYTSEQGRSTDFMFGQRSAMVGLSKLAEAVLGTGTLISGLTVGANSPAAMNVVVQPGQIYELEALDATAYGILPADTTHNIVKQGLLMDALTVACPAPVTSGYSINYLIQATYQDQDTTPVVLPYFNSANPSQPLSGQSNSGAAQATERQGVCVVNAKAGAAATTGTQTTPSPDSGYVGIAVVTVDYGASTIVAGNISAYAGVPRIPTTLPNAAGLSLANIFTLAGNQFTNPLLVAPATESGHAVNYGQFAVGSLTDMNISFTLPNGIIVKMFDTVMNSNAVGTTNTSLFPTAFPTGCYGVLVSNGDPITQPSAIVGGILGSHTPSSFGWRSSVAGSNRINVIAIGN